MNESIISWDSPEKDPFRGSYRKVDGKENEWIFFKRNFDGGVLTEGYLLELTPTDTGCSADAREVSYYTSSGYMCMSDYGNGFCGFWNVFNNVDSPFNLTVVGYCSAPANPADTCIVNKPE